MIKDKYTALNIHRKGTFRHWLFNHSQIYRHYEIKKIRMSYQQLVDYNLWVGSKLYDTPEETNILKLIGENEEKKIIL